MANPAEEFVIASISREKIAPDSDLLTRKLCGDLAVRLGAVASDFDDHENLERYRNEIIGAWNITLDSLPLVWDEDPGTWSLKPAQS